MFLARHRSFFPTHPRIHQHTHPPTRPPQVSDFGLARPLEVLTQLSTDTYGTSERSMHEGALQT